MTERYRPHHIFCQRFLKVGFPERGEAFAGAKQKALDIIGSAEDTRVEAALGVDQICSVCANRKGERCESEKGNEDAVRKWDAIILKGLGIAYGETRTAKEWRALIDEKRPLPLCETRCPYRSQCAVGDR